MYSHFMQSHPAAVSCNTAQLSVSSVTYSLISNTNLTHLVYQSAIDSFSPSTM